MRQFQYEEHDFAFGQAMLTLRTAIGLTQARLAACLGISRRAVGDWEAGNKYPKPNHLRHFIELAVQHQAFAAGHEAQEIRTIWKLARQRVWLDEGWLARLVPSGSHLASNSPLSRTEWRDKLNIPTFIGSEAEMQELKKAVVEEGCRVVGVLGLGGSGQAALAGNLMHSVAGHFEAVIWRSLQDAPAGEAVLNGCLQVLAPQAMSVALPSLEARFNLLGEQLLRRRVLVVLDGLESLLVEGQGRIRAGYEIYGRLLRLFSTSPHQSCLVFTSREKPAELVARPGIKVKVCTGASGIYVL